VQVTALGPSWLDPDHLIRTFGMIGIMAIVFAESGLLVGFFLPGDSLLFTAGLLVATTDLLPSLPVVIPLVIVAAVAGDQVGYMIGAKVGPRIFHRPDSRLFRREYVDKAYSYFERYGGRTIVLARFVPIVRTFAPVVAGVSGMRYRTFVTYNVVGGVLWGAGVTTLGYYLGQVDFVAAHIELILILIVALSVLPIAVELLRARSRTRAAEAYGDGEDRTETTGSPPSAGTGTD
jgi:membrane-associated protein